MKTAPVISNDLHPSSGQETIWAFDLGKSSIGEVVRRGAQFLHKASLLIPADFADTKPAGKRRRMWRTRTAHRERERWLEQIWAAAGLHVLYGRNRDGRTGKWKAGETADRRLEREFAEPGDDTCYTSCLLRIKMLREEKLEEWQIFKALHSAIQRRGYDKTIPWAQKEARRAGKSPEDLEKEEQKKDRGYLAALNRWSEFKTQVAPQFSFPCYYDAWRMGLWNPAEPERLRPRTTYRAESTRNVRFDRQDVEAEITRLAKNAAKSLPALAAAFARIESGGWEQTDAESGRKKRFPVRAQTFGDFLCHGPAGVAYASFSAKSRKEIGLHTGSADDWMGSLGQKIPRFDNRILDDCVLIPRFHVCKAEIRKSTVTGLPLPNTLLSAQVTFLMKLKNTVVADGPNQRKLRVDEVQKIFKTAFADARKVKPNAEDWPRKAADCFALTRADWFRTKGIKELALRPLPGHEVIKPPKDSGRSGFSRPALRLLRTLILLGKDPCAFHAEQLAKLNGNTNPLKGLVPHDLKFLLDMGGSWMDIHIRAQKLDSLAARHTEDGKLDAAAATADLLGSVNDPVVRHRLNVFAGRLRELRGRFGRPDEVVLEFIREDFMGPKRKAELLQFQRDREKARKEAREKAKEAGAEEKSAALKYELCKAQGCLCLYCGQPFAASRLEEYEIEHIVPHSQGGPDAMVNYVLAHRHCNEAKGELTPFQWKHGQEGWDGYKRLVESHAVTLRNKKVQLLLREDATDLVNRYTALAETAWISKLAQTIVSLYFGWKNGNDAEGRKRVTIVSGGLTDRVRRKYHLNSVLNPCPKDEDPFLWEEACEKNRSDDRHHALDAMVISFIPGWMRDARKEHFFRFPKPVHKNAKAFFAKEISGVMPRAVAYERAALAETIYGARPTDKGLVIVQRVALHGLAMKPIAPGKARFDTTYLRKQINAVRDAGIAATITDFLETAPDEAAWDRFCQEFRLHCQDGSPGQRVVRVSVNVGEPDEYREMSKDGTGAWRKGLGSHKGQIIFWDERGELSVRPVFAHGSVGRERRAVESLGGKAKFYAFFQSDCAVRTTKTIPAEAYRLVVKNEAKQKRRISAEKPLPACELTLRTIVTKGRIAELTLADNTRVVAPLDVWVEAGLSRTR
jgi:CRISPR-associated endonuclease Csn1